MCINSSAEKTNKNNPAPVHHYDTMTHGRQYNFTTLNIHCHHKFWLAAMECHQRQKLTCLKGPPPGCLSAASCFKSELEHRACSKWKSNRLCCGHLALLARFVAAIQSGASGPFWNRNITANVLLQKSHICVQEPWYKTTYSVSSSQVGTNLNTTTVHTAIQYITSFPAWT
jgi:hypothetical protein